MNRTSVRLWDFASGVILILLLLTVGQRLYITHWAPGLGTTIILLLIGVVLGLTLGVSKFKPMAVFWFSFGYSLPILILVLGGILYRGIPWLERLADLGNRLAYALGLLFIKQPVQDTVLFVVFMALIFWVIGLTAGYATTCFGNFLGAVVPAGVVLVVIQLYDPGRANSDTYLAVYLFLSLLFLGRLTYVQRRSVWKEQHVTLLAESRTDLNIILAVVALAAVMLVWLTPTSVESFSNARKAWENITKPLNEVQKNLGHAVAGLQGRPKVNTVQFFGDALPLGNKAATGETAFLRIQPPMVTTTSRYYWRVRSYNIYFDNQWYAENVSNAPFTPDQALIKLVNPEGMTSRFIFTSLSANLETLVTPARPVWVSPPSKLYFVQGPEDEKDPIQFQPASPVKAGDLYTVRANVYEPTIRQLRSAGENYPDWIMSHYLELPANLPPDITALAQQITTGAETPYDMAVAITTYLRENISYSLTVEDPPAGQDPLDWFLFDSKRGFCNYFATAEVILLRAAKIPSRMVVGFAQGEFISPNYYVVRQRDLHAWPEVYFPGIGWVEFEPTTSQRPLERPQGASFPSIETTGTQVPNEPTAKGQGSLSPAGGQKSGPVTGIFTNPLVRLLLRLILLGLIGAILLRIYTFGTFGNNPKDDLSISRRPIPVLLRTFLEQRALTPPGWLQHWAYLAELNSIERYFVTVYRSLHWVGIRPSVSQTPAEAARALTKELPAVSKEIDSLLNEYQRQLYSQKHGSPPFARRAMRVIRKEALRVALLQRWAAIRNVFRLRPRETGD